MSIKRYVFGQSIKSNTNFIGPDLGVGIAKWAGGGLASNGQMYFAPYFQSMFLEFNPKTGKSSMIGNNILEEMRAIWAQFLRLMVKCIQHH